LATAASQTAAHVWAREYETIYILRPDVDPDEADRVAQRVADVVAKQRGKLVKVDNWGKRRLAYPIRKLTRGIFVYIKYLGYEGIVRELERNLHMLDVVVRWQTIVIGGQHDPEAVAVDPEEVKFLRIEHTEEEEVEETVEQRLGMAAAGTADEEEDFEAEPAEEEPPAVEEEAKPEADGEESAT
jgi:small subunit ribosomal protein S6